jgi:glycine cleavage system H protein
MASIDNYTLPDDLYYHRDSHLWLRVQNGQVTIGLDVLGQESMGDIAYVSFEPVGTRAQSGDPVGSMEAAKMVAPFLAPVSGIIVKRNEVLARTPHLINEHPYDEGWLLVLEPTRWAEESKALLSGAHDVQAFLEEELKRYREQGWID